MNFTATSRIVGLLLMITLAGFACSQPSTTSNRPPNGPRRSPGCDAPTFHAEVGVRNLNLTPERGPAPELGSTADLIWTFPEPQSSAGRIMGVELFRGRMNPIMNSPYEGRSVKVRGFPATFGMVEDGFGILWEEGNKPCERYAITAYGLSAQETLTFANGLKN